MRTALSRLAVAAVIGATAAGVGTLHAATLPVPGTPHAAAYIERSTEHVRPANFDCWAEKVHGAIEDVEIICGDKGDRPRTDTADIGSTVYVAADPLDGGYEPWVVTITGLEPDSAN